ncbi:MAG: hypothetical protein OEL87_02610 [Nanoarchaeota archaeon]|nr:hypothetical protein [Nanoarchaeota archaeon]
MEQEKILEIIRSSGDIGRTITEIVVISRLPRSVVRILLARLEGAQSINFRKVGMAKIYSINPKLIEAIQQ